MTVEGRHTRRRQREDDLRREEAWVARYKLRESDAARCEHALRVGRCGVAECYRGERWRDFLDHARMWRYPDGRLFLLAHVYDWDDDKHQAAKEWTEEHGLSWAILWPDGWYGYGTTPVRFWFEPDFRFVMAGGLVLMDPLPGSVRA